ncbi:HNH endonuclease family protein [Microtetraspora sp. NBRC 16547]|uniref:HNH endonuclease family protein n=1 Tax=Microtetraspora sp. NBRC 16547 TaxID=3030993 RepID=UPI0024A5EFDD|nr:HNH endonuclease family protein [Microtetraspora sp. NBRC 16547]GLX01061.1 lipoprotein [Microtetraspora sp. NBRC 16547]
MGILLPSLIGEAVLGAREIVVVVVAGIVLASVATNTTHRSAGTTAGKAADARARAVPLHNTRGTKPGLAPITSAKDRAAAVALIRKLRVKGSGPKTGYARTRFGENWADTADGVPYAGNGCNTRNDLLARDGRNVRYRKGSDCVVIRMTLKDPYTGRTIRWRKQRADLVQVDHVVPMSYSWRMGAAHWPMAKRLRIANDPLNLLPVYGPANEAKGGSGPASWLPPSRKIRCAYVVRFAQVALKYDLPVTRADKAAMLAQCR